MRLVYRFLNQSLRVHALCLWGEDKVNFNGDVHGFGSVGFDADV